MVSSSSQSSHAPFRTVASVRYELITLGDELLLGLTANSHLTFIGAALGRQGARLGRNVTITDDADAIAAALARISEENLDWDVYFAQHNINPLHITYEQLTRDMESTIKRVMTFIGSPVEVVPAPQTKKQGDSINKDWAERFLAEYPEHVGRTTMWQGLQ